MIYIYICVESRVLPAIIVLHLSAVFRLILKTGVDWFDFETSLLHPWICLLYHLFSIWFWRPEWIGLILMCLAPSADRSLKTWFEWWNLWASLALWWGIQLVHRQAQVLISFSSPFSAKAVVYGLLWLCHPQDLSCDYAPHTGCQRFQIFFLCPPTRSGKTDTAVCLTSFALVVTVALGILPPSPLILGLEFPFPVPSQQQLSLTQV